MVGWIAVLFWDIDDAGLCQAGFSHGYGRPVSRGRSMRRAAGETQRRECYQNPRKFSRASSPRKETEVLFQA